jgi:hypothetical protein
VKTWAVRGTLHLLPAGEAATWIGAQGALPARWEKPGWRRGFGVTDEDVDGIRAAVPEALAGEPLDRVYRPQGWLSPVLLVDGRTAGVWRHETRAGSVTVEIEPFGRVAKGVRAAAEAEAQRLAAVLGGELDLAWTTP